LPNMRLVVEVVFAFTVAGPNLTFPPISTVLEKPNFVLLAVCSRVCALEAENTSLVLNVSSHSGLKSSCFM